MAGRAVREEGVGEPFNATGGCHCGAVRFRFRVPWRVEANRCNCSICAMTGFVHLVVPHGDFELQAGAEDLFEYRFNTGTARHLFCRHCGIKSFYQPRSHPEAWSVHLGCAKLDPSVEVALGEFDGRNWEASIDSIRHLGR